MLRVDNEWEVYTSSRKKHAFLSLDESFVVKFRISPLVVMLSNSSFHPLEDVSRYRDPQLQVGENYSYVFNFRPNICKY